MSRDSFPGVVSLETSFSVSTVTIGHRLVVIAFCVVALIQANEIALHDDIVVGFDFQIARTRFQFKFPG